jgi:predicted RNA-binding protein
MGAQQSRNERAVAACRARELDVRDAIMESVDILRPEGGRIYIQDIFGEQRWVEARIKEMNLVQHRIVLEEN